jgi:hypothetical protein
MKKERDAGVHSEEEISPNSRVASRRIAMQNCTMNPQLSAVCYRRLSSMSPIVACRVSSVIDARRGRRHPRICSLQVQRPAMQKVTWSTGCRGAARRGNLALNANKREKKGARCIVKRLFSASPPRRRCTSGRIRIFRQFYCHAAYTRARARAASAEFYIS